MAIIRERPADEVQSGLGENPSSNPRAVIGGNAPPPEEQVKIDFHEAMLDKHPTYSQRIAELHAAAVRVEITDEVMAGKSADVIKSIRAMKAAVEDAHKTVKAPYWEAGKVADSLKNNLVFDLDAAMKILGAKQTEFLRQEQARREAEQRQREMEARREAEAAAEAERQRLAAEAENNPEALAEVEVVAAPAVVQRAPEPIRSVDTGATISGRKEWQCEVTDYTVAVIQVLDDPKVKEAVDAAVKRRVKAGIHNIEGVRIWQAVVARTY